MMRMSLRRRASAAAIATGFVLSLPALAHATGITEFPDNGSEQGGRGGAWVARASDPLAVFYNPAGLAGQPTRLIVQSNFNTEKTCFTRLKAANDPTLDADGTKPGQYYPQICSANQTAIDPQIAMTYRLTSRIGIGFAPLLAPSGAVSNGSAPQFIQSTSASGAKVYEPGPSRYLLTSANLLVLNPTLGIGAEVMDRLRLGASFTWGIASLKFTNGIAATANQVAAGGTYVPGTEVQAVANVHDYFVPGFNLGAIYSPSDDFDIAAWYKWSDAIKAEGDIQTSTSYYTAAVAQGKTGAVSTGNTALANCGVPGPSTTCGSGNNVHLQVAQPMEAKIGFRYHKRRDDVPYDEHVRDPMAQDVFDIEADLTWANDSAFSNLQVRLPGTATGDGVLPINGIPGTSAPPNDDIPHGFKDVYGIRIGGDYNVLRDQLALRAGGFLQSNGQNPQDQNVDFAGSMNGGFALGATYRLHLSKEKANAIEFSLGYEHVFYMDESYTGSNGIQAIAGTACPPNTTENPATNTCSNGVTRYRTAWDINLGTITNSINVLNVGLGYKF